MSVRSVRISFAVWIFTLELHHHTVLIGRFVDIFDRPDSVTHICKFNQSVRLGKKYIETE